MSDQTKERCQHKRLNEDGICHNCGSDERGVGHDVSPVIPAITEWDMDIPRKNKLESWPIDKLPTPKVAPVAPAVAKEQAKDWHMRNRIRFLTGETVLIQFKKDEPFHEVPYLDEPAMLAEYAASLSQEIERLTRERKWVDAEHLRIGVVRTVGVASFDDLMTTPFLFNRRAEAAERSLETAREAVRHQVSALKNGGGTGHVIVALETALALSGEGK
jgi:tRNA/tmRNA/rRNA uracil-C5-methylase (TrmA/RlmC/RlmD family)